METKVQNSTPLMKWHYLFTQTVFNMIAPKGFHRVLKGEHRGYQVPKQLIIKESIEELAKKCAENLDVYRSELHRHVTDMLDATNGRIAILEGDIEKSKSLLNPMKKELGEVTKLIEVRRAYEYTVMLINTMDCPIVQAAKEETVKASMSVNK